MNAVAKPLFGQALTDPPRPGSPRSQPFSGAQKAAIIVRLLLSDGVRLPLQDLPEPMQGALTEQMAQLTTVDRDTVRAIVSEFVTRIESIGLSFPGGIEGALTLLDGQISEGTMARLRRRVDRRGSPDDPWDRVGAADPAKLAEVVAAESAEVAAVALSKLPVARAADILGRLPGDQARRIAYTMSLTGTADPDAVDRIGIAFLEALETEPPQAFDGGPVERVGAILNLAPAAMRDTVLAGLDADDATFAGRVRRAIFTFADIPSRIAPRDVPRIVRGVDPAVLVTAVAGASPGPEAEAAEFILAGLSQRLAASVRDDAAAKGPVKEKEAEAAMSAIVASARELAQAGEIAFVVPDEGED